MTNGFFTDMCEYDYVYDNYDPIRKLKEDIIPVWDRLWIKEANGNKQGQLWLFSRLPYSSNYTYFYTITLAVTSVIN